MRVLPLILLFWATSPGLVDVVPALSTEQVASDPDDPAIWINPRNASNSLILGTNKTPAPTGALVAFGLDGKVKQVVDGIDRPNNVDVEYGFRIGGNVGDIAVLTERLKRRLRVFSIHPATGHLTDMSATGGMAVFQDQPGESGAPMGIALYRRPRDQAIFAIVGRKTGPASGYLWQYKLTEDTGKVKAVKVREFGKFSGVGEIEAIAVDDELGHVYYADEGDGIHKWHADPDHPDAGTELAHFGREGFGADREGIAIYRTGRRTGYILCTDQLAGSSEYRIYRREGKAGNQHDHSEAVAVIRGKSDSTDGLEATSASVGPRFPSGLMVAMNSSGRNFQMYDWAAIVKASGNKLSSK